MSNIYSFEDIEKIANKISKIRKKKILEKIRDIIIEYNPDIKITENTNGLFFHFHNLYTETYQKINILLNNINKTNKISDNSDQISSEINSYSNKENIFDSNSKIKYSNKEKKIIKRKKLYNIINGEEVRENFNDIKNNIINDNSNIFIKKKITNN